VFTTLVWFPQQRRTGPEFWIDAGTTLSPRHTRLAATHPDCGTTLAPKTCAVKIAPWHRGESRNLSQRSPKRRSRPLRLQVPPGNSGAVISVTTSLLVLFQPYLTLPRGYPGYHDMLQQKSSSPSLSTSSRQEHCVRGQANACCIRNSY
jgi:hypothetical protein